MPTEEQDNYLDAEPNSDHLMSNIRVNPDSSVRVHLPCCVYFWLGISINSDTSSDPPISRKGQAFAIDSAASIESASIIVYPDIVVALPAVTVPSEFTVLVSGMSQVSLTFFSGRTP